MFCQSDQAPYSFIQSLKRDPQYHLVVLHYTENYAGRFTFRLLCDEDDLEDYLERFREVVKGTTKEIGSILKDDHNMKEEEVKELFSQNIHVDFVLLFFSLLFSFTRNMR